MTFNEQIAAGLTAEDRIIYSWIQYAKEKGISDSVSPQWLAGKCAGLEPGAIGDSLAKMVNGGQVEMVHIPGSTIGYTFAIKSTR